MGKHKIISITFCMFGYVVLGKNGLFTIQQKKNLLIINIGKLYNFEITIIFILGVGIL